MWDLQIYWRNGKCDCGTRQLRQFMLVLTRQSAQQVWILLGFCLNAAV